MMPGALDMDLPLEDIRGFSVSGVAIFTQVTIHSRKGETFFLLSTLPAVQSESKRLASKCNFRFATLENWNLEETSAGKRR